MKELRQPPKVYRPGESLPRGDGPMIELGQEDYKTEPRAGEPIFGAGWPLPIALAASIVTGVAVADWLADKSFFSVVVSGFAAICVGGFVYPILNALVSDRQLQAHRPPPDLPHSR